MFIRGLGHSRYGTIKISKTISTETIFENLHQQWRRLHINNIFLERDAKQYAKNVQTNIFFKTIFKNTYFLEKIIAKEGKFFC